MTELARPGGVVVRCFAVASGLWPGRPIRYRPRGKPKRLDGRCRYGNKNDCSGGRRGLRYHQRSHHSWFCPKGRAPVAQATPRVAVRRGGGTPARGSLLRSRVASMNLVVIRSAAGQSCWLTARHRTLFVADGVLLHTPSVRTGSDACANRPANGRPSGGDQPVSFGRTALTTLSVVHLCRKARIRAKLGISITHTDHRYLTRAVEPALRATPPATDGRGSAVAKGNGTGQRGVSGHSPS